MSRLTDTAIRAAIGKPRIDRVDLADGAVPGLTLRIGKARGGTWSLVLRVVGESSAELALRIRVIVGRVIARRRHS